MQGEITPNRNVGAGHGSYVVAKFLILIFGVFPVV